ncbi:MAG: thioredoxin [Thiothrix sp.]|nr:thioredoxin [Thiothrix sp.]
MAESPYIFEANAQNFAQVVLQNSLQVPVLVDFWADWCQPCKTLMPMLARLADEYQGGFILAKVDTDQNRELAAQFGVRSLPTVKVFKGGRMVDEFMGALPESEVRQFINKHRMRMTAPYHQQALAMHEEGDAEGALDLMRQVVQHEPDYHEAVLDLALMLLQQGELDEAEQLAQSLPENADVPPERLQQLRADIKMARLRSEASDEDSSALEQRLAADPDDLEAMLELARVRVAQGEAEAGLKLYLAVMQKDRSFGEDAGRQGLLNTFELLGAASPLVKKYRGKMFSLLY